MQVSAVTITDTLPCPSSALHPAGCACARGHADIHAPAHANFGPATRSLKCTLLDPGVFHSSPLRTMSVAPR